KASVHAIDGKRKMKWDNGSDKANARVGKTNHLGRIFMYIKVIRCGRSCFFSK
ncbi:10406_t:CDS:1, partial [Ambispora gerdemannii]